MIHDETAMNNGVIFLHAFDILKERMQQGINRGAQGGNVLKGKPAWDATLLVPVVVNGSLACELFMKSMLPQGTRGHKLEELFALLDNALQEKIKQFTIAEMKKGNAAYSETEFQNDLDGNNDVFIEWRYFHEGNSHSVNYQFVGAFLKSIFAVVDEERKK